MNYVLLVEDDPCNQTVVEDIFEFDEPGAELVCVDSGEGALQRVVQQKPCLILMDIRLPGMDGLETTRRLKESPATRDIPVWALTAHAMKGDHERVLAAGCDDYITKPIDTKSLTQRLRAFLEAVPDPEAILCRKC